MDDKEFQSWLDDELVNRAIEAIVLGQVSDPLEVWNIADEKADHPIGGGDYTILYKKFAPVGLYATALAELQHRTESLTKEVS